LASLLHGVLAYDPSPLQDFCIADFSSSVNMNGFPCKKSSTVTVNDFLFTDNILRRRPPTTDIGTTVTGVTVNNFPALNTQGISLERIDYDGYGINPPHFHPRGSEVITVLYGRIYAGFVTAAPENRLFAKVLKTGDTMIFPYAQIHFQINLGRRRAAAFSALSSQLPGVIRVADTMFGSQPSVLTDLLARSFRIRKNEVQRLQSSFSNITR